MFMHYFDQIFETTMEGGPYLEHIPVHLPRTFPEPPLRIEYLDIVSEDVFVEMGHEGVDADACLFQHSQSTQGRLPDIGNQETYAFREELPSDQTTTFWYMPWQRHPYARKHAHSFFTDGY